MIQQGRFAGPDFGLGKTVENSLYEIVVGRGTLRINHFLGCVIVRDQIGEGAANIDGNGVRHSKKGIKDEG